jgi:hypothetical protein
MSGLEILGAAAAASQLTQQGLKIINLISELAVKIRDAPESIHKNKVQVEQLIELAGLVKNNPPLQTPLMDSILHVCTDEAKQVLEILSNICTKFGDGRVVKLWKALGGVVRESKILALFAKLEQGKSTLALCIATIDS